MMIFKKRNNYLESAFQFIAAFLLLLILIVWLVSCSTPAKTARKNEEAYQRVLTDSGMLRKAWYAYNRTQPPCANDTIIGETQVLILSDTTVLPGKTDTITRPDTIRIATIKVKKETQYITDTKAIHELQDSLHAARFREAQKDGQILQLTKDRQDQEKRAVLAEKRQKQLGWGLWGMLLVLVVTHGLRSLPSLRKAIGI